MSDQFVLVSAMNWPRTSCPFWELPSKAHPLICSYCSTSSKKGLGTLLSISYNRQTFQQVAASERVRWTKNPSNTNELDLAKQIWGGNTHMGNKSSASQPNGNPSWPIEIFMPAGFGLELLCARAPCVEMVSDLNSTEQPGLVYSETKRSQSCSGVLK